MEECVPSRCNSFPLTSAHIQAAYIERQALPGHLGGHPPAAPPPPLRLALSLFSLLQDGRDPGPPVCHSSPAPPPAGHDPSHLHSVYFFF